MKKLNKFSMATLAVVFVFGFIGPITILAAGPAMVDLGSARDFVILAKSGISTIGVTSVIGDIGVSPVTATSITGFGLILPAASAFSTSALVTGKVYAPDYASPTPVKMTTVISDMETAYTNAMGRTNPTATELGAGNIGGMTLAPGLYKWGTGVTIPTDVTLSGSANDVWIFQIAQNLDISSATKVILSGGAKASNIFWVVAGQTTIGTTAILNGNVLDQTTIVLNTGASLNGRALAQAAVTLDSNTVVMPTSSTSNSNNPIACTQEAKRCSDGSYVSRSGANCEFAQCPEITPTPQPTCLNLYWLDNTNKTCQSQKLFCGAYMYQGLQTFTTQQSCLNATTQVVLPSSSLFGQTISAIAGSLKAGSMGEFVKTLQKFLLSQDVENQALKKYGADGKFGSTTKAALIKWQLAHDLVGDGIFGAKTKAKIKDLGL